MASRKTIPHSRYQKIVEEAQAVAETVKTPGWKILEDDLLRQATRIQELLAENRLRTVSETITQGGTTKTFTTTAETQIAENAGMYKQIHQLFTTIQTIIEAPDKLLKLEAEGKVAIQKGATESEVVTSPVKGPALLEKVRSKISRLAKKRLYL